MNGDSEDISLGKLLFMGIGLFYTRMIEKLSNLIKR